MTDLREGSTGDGVAYVPSPGNPGPHPHPRKPSIVLPANSCDSHCHILGPANRFPYAVDRTFTPHDAPKEEVFALQRFLGLERAVIVQSSCDGFDHSGLLDALASDPERLRGVALLHESMSVADLELMHLAGVRGHRLNFMPHLGTAPSVDAITSSIDRVRDFGWHTEVHISGSGSVDMFDLIRSVATPVVIDHLGRVDLRDGIFGPSVGAMLRLLDTGNVWVKVSGIDRVSIEGAPFDDAVELAALYTRHAPERVLWGTDYPHVNIAADAPDDGLLVDLVSRIAPSEDALEKLLVSNPTDFFDFAR